MFCRNVFCDWLCELRHLCSWHLHGRQHFCVHGVSRWVVLGHLGVRLLHHVHVRHVRGCGLCELHQLCGGLLLSVVCRGVLSVCGRHLRRRWFCRVHHLHGWNLRGHGVSDLLALCGRHVLRQWFWHVHQVHWWHRFGRRFRVVCDVQCGEVRGPWFRHLLQLRRR